MDSDSVSIFKFQIHVVLSHICFGYHISRLCVKRNPIPSPFFVTSNFDNRLQWKNERGVC